MNEMTTPIDTPRTDAAQWGHGKVTADFARQLERELNAATNQLDSIRAVFQHGADEENWKPGTSLAQSVAELKAEVEELRKYADKLAAGFPVGMLPKDIENLRDSNAHLAMEHCRLEWVREHYFPDENNFRKNIDAAMKGNQ